MGAWAASRGAFLRRGGTDHAERPWDARSRSGLALVCIALALALGAQYPRFLSFDNLFITLLSVTSIGVAALGSMLLLISGNIDLSIGGQYAFIGMLTGIVARDSQSMTLAIITALVAGAAIGYFNGRLVRLLKINPLIVTLGMATILHGFAFVLSDGVTVFGFPEELVSLGQTYWGPVPLPVIVGAIVFLLVSVVLLRTVVGLRVYAIGGSPGAARLCGIETDRYVTGLFAFNGMLIGLVALMSVSRLGSASPNVGTGFELEVLTAVILGGVGFLGGSGHPLGVLIGVVTIGVLNAGVVFAGIADFWQLIVQGCSLLIALGADQIAARRRARRRVVTEHAEPLEQDSLAEGAALAARRSVGERESEDAALPAGDVAVRCEGLTKHYGSVTAVRDVGFEVRSGEVVCLVGDNGAGKSTVIKILSGALEADAGTIEVGGAETRFAGPADARAAGIATAYQDLALCPNLGVAENLTLGDEPTRTRWGVLSWRDDRAAERQAHERLQRLRIRLDDYRQPVRLLSGGQRQSVAVARVAVPDARLVILDEPTAALGVRQTESVIQLVQSLASVGVAVIVISHDVETVFRLADRLVVLRLGTVAYSGPASTLSQSDLIHLMAGFPISGSPHADTTSRIAGGRDA